MQPRKYLTNIRFIGTLRKVEKDATVPPVQSRSEKEDEKEEIFERLE